MTDTNPSTCQCTTCPGADCRCGCRPAAEPSVAQNAAPAARPCGPQCRCGADCRCARS